MPSLSSQLVRHFYLKLVARLATRKLKPSTARCFVIASAETIPDCQGAAFGSYLPFVAEDSDTTKPSLATATQVVALPPEADQLACEVFGAQHAMIENATVIVRRGGCSFQQKVGV